MQFVPYCKCFSVHHFHGVEALRLLRQPLQGGSGVPYLAKVHITYVAAAEAAEEPEMVETNSAFGAPEPPHGFPCSLVRLVGLVSWAELGGLRSGGGTDGDGAPAPAAEAEVAHPATARVRHGYGGRATVIVGWFSTCYGCHCRSVWENAEKKACICFLKLCYFALWEGFYKRACGN